MSARGRKQHSMATARFAVQLAVPVAPLSAFNLPSFFRPTQAESVCFFLKGSSGDATGTTTQGPVGPRMSCVAREKPRKGNVWYVHAPASG
jgi:hypothetical protein